MDLFGITSVLALISFGVIDYAALRLLWVSTLPMPFNVNPTAFLLWGLLGFIVVAPVMLAAIWQMREQSALADNE